MSWKPPYDWRRCTAAQSKSFIRENPNLKMIWGYPHDLGNLHIFTSILSSWPPTVVSCARIPVPAPRCRPVACFVVKSPPRRCLDGDAAKAMGKWRGVNGLVNQWKSNVNPMKVMVNLRDVQMIYDEMNGPIACEAVYCLTVLLWQ